MGVTGEGGEDQAVERLRAEVNRLRQSDGRLRHMLTAAPDFIARITTEGTFLYLNKVAPGFDLEDVIGTSVLTYTAPNDHETTLAAIAKAAATAETQEYVVVGQGANGEPRHYLTKVSPILEDGKVDSLVMTASDVTPLEEARAELRHHQAQLTVAIEATNLGIWTVVSSASGQGELAGGTWDAALRAIFGYSADDERAPTPELVFGRIHPDDVDAVSTAVAQAFQTRSDYSLEYRVRWPDGTVRHVAACGRVTEEPEDMLRMIGTSRDITERKALEARLLEAQKLESIGRLAGGIAHDFNNLLTTITNAAHFLRQAVEGTEHVEFVEDISLAAQRSAALTHQLLAFARRQVFEPRVVEPNDLVRRVESLVRRILGEHILLAFEYGASGRLRVDPSQLEQVLLNLVTNARDAMPDGGRLTIETHDVELDQRGAARASLSPGRYVKLVVADTGEGIATDDLPHVFEPFFTTKGLQGTGLGLATCYGIVKQNGGTIAAISEPGGGTTFEIHLPHSEDELSDAERRPSVTAAAGGQTVLLVEDEDTVRRLLERALVAAGFQVLAASDGRKALEVAKDHNSEIHVLLTDVVMPYLGGPELAAALKQSRPNITVMYMSGYAENSLARDGEFDPDLQFLQKPFSPSALVAKITDALCRSAAK